MAKIKKPRNKKYKAPRTETEEVSNFSYEISVEPLIDQKFQRLPKAVQDELGELYELAQKNGKQAIPRLEALKAEYPKLPLIYNYLAVAYGGVDSQKQQQIIIENYQQNPSYLFARCNYAQLCLRTNNLEGFAKVFEHKFDLKLLYPRRNRFHITEYIGFTAGVCEYFYKAGNMEQAQKLFESLENVAADEPQTKRLKAMLYPNRFQRMVKKIVSGLTAPKSDALT